MEHHKELTRICANCQQELEISSFKKHNTAASGYSKICKRCSRRGAKTKSQRAAIPPPDGVISKQCSKCRSEVLLTDFAPAKGGKYQRHSVCKACVRSVHHANRNLRNETRRQERMQDDWFRLYALDYGRKNRHIWIRCNKRAKLAGRDWRTLNPERNRFTAKLYARKWRLEHPEIEKMRGAARHARRQAQSALGSSDLRQLWQSQNGRCRWCDAVLLINGASHLDHIIPLSKGGDNRLSNLCWACEACNLKKHDKMPHEIFGVLF